MRWFEEKAIRATIYEVPYPPAEARWLFSVSALKNQESSCRWSLHLDHSHTINIDCIGGGAALLHTLQGGAAGGSNERT